MISDSKQIPDFDEEFEKDYSPYLVNNFFSYFFDTAGFVNLINRKSVMPKKTHFLFLHSLIPKKSRWSKWHKQTKSKDIDMIMDIYNVNSSKAKIALSLLTKDNMKVLRQTQKTGGRK